MDNKEIVRTIYRLSNSVSDKGLLVLKILQMAGEKNSLSEIVKLYEQLLEGKVRIVEVMTHNELTGEQKSELEEKLNSKFENIGLIFEYISSEKNKPGILIRMGDSVLDGTI